MSSRLLPPKHGTQALDSTDGVLANRIVPQIQELFKEDAAWIQRRIIENRERYEEELTFKYEVDVIPEHVYEDDDETDEDKAESPKKSTFGDGILDE